MRVLVAEDDPGLRSVLERGLREHGYVVDAVADGDDALAYLRSYAYEVAVLDWRMPTTTGIEVVRRMRARGDRTPVLMLTARDATEDRVEGLNAGADDYLVKPFSFAELTARLTALQRRPPLSLDPGARLRRPRLRPRHPDRPPGDGRAAAAHRHRDRRCSSCCCAGRRPRSTARPSPCRSGTTRPTRSAPTPSTSTWAGSGPSSPAPPPASRRCAGFGYRIVAG